MIHEHLQQLCHPRGRMVGSPGHASARNYISKCLVEAGFTVEVDFYSEEFPDLANIIAISEPAESYILVGAHYDSFLDAECANDNASSVALILELAEYLKGLKLAHHGVMMVVFDGEEPPHYLSPTMGSKNFVGQRSQQGQGLIARHYPEAIGFNIRFAIIMDLVGHQNSFGGFYAAGPAYREIGDGGEAVLVAPQIIELISDHGAFASSNIPYVLLTCGNDNNIHSPRDTIAHLDIPTIERVGEYIKWLIPKIDVEYVTIVPLADRELLYHKSLLKADPKALDTGEYFESAHAIFFDHPRSLSGDTLLSMPSDELEGFEDYLDLFQDPRFLRMVHDRRAFEARHRGQSQDARGQEDQSSMPPHPLERLIGHRLHRQEDSQPETDLPDSDQQ